MKINFIYKPSVFRALWTYDLPKLEQHRWKWLDVTNYDVEARLEAMFFDGQPIYNIDDDFPYKHLDDPRIGDTHELTRQEPKTIPF